MLRLTDMPLGGRRVLVRADFNVPMDDEGAIRSDARIRATLPTLQHIMGQGAQLRLMSHLGRPQEGTFDQRFSLAPVAQRLGQLLGRPVRLHKAAWTSPAMGGRCCWRMCASTAARPPMMRSWGRAMPRSARSL